MILTGTTEQRTTAFDWAMRFSRPSASTRTRVRARAQLQTHAVGSIISFPHLRQRWQRNIFHGSCALFLCAFTIQTFLYLNLEQNKLQMRTNVFFYAAFNTAKVRLSKF